MTRKIGIPDLKEPEKKCEDPNCPFHGELKVRGRQYLGKVVSTKMNRTIVVKRDYAFYVSKFQRYERRNSKYSVHLPDCIEVKVGDTVRYSECRKLCKTVTSVVIERSKEAEI